MTGWPGRRRSRKPCGTGSWPPISVSLTTRASVPAATRRRCSLRAHRRRSSASRLWAVTGASRSASPTSTRCGSHAWSASTAASPAWSSTTSATGCTSSTWAATRSWPGSSATGKSTGRSSRSWWPDRKSSGSPRSGWSTRWPRPCSRRRTGTRSLKPPGRDRKRRTPGLRLSRLLTGRLPPSLREPARCGSCRGRIRAFRRRRAGTRRRVARRARRTGWRPGTARPRPNPGQNPGPTFGLIPGLTRGQTLGPIPGLSHSWLPGLSPGPGLAAVG